MTHPFVWLVFTFEYIVGVYYRDMAMMILATGCLVIACVITLRQHMTHSPTT